ncbi:cache domain-containing protein [Calothrix sp. CCY 0018]|uniref:cache domain-containing protein n=1 Tax=Calothrix sp. CCY 0018 TaxID=3103864 RepID=UPI0039C74C0A
MGTVAIIQYFSFKNSYEAVNNIVSQLRSEISDRIEQHLSNYLEKPHLINQNNFLSYQIGLLDLNNQDALGRQFWQQRQAYNINAVYFGNNKGGYVGAEPSDTITITENFLPGQFLYYNTNDKGLKLANPKIGKKIFDSRARPWYKASENRKTSNWSSIYTYEDGSDIAITATTPVYKDSKFQEVLASDLSLKQITNFLREIRVSKTGKTFILDGELAEIRDLKLQTLSDFENGLENYRCGDCVKAKVYFEKVLAVNPEDKAAALYLERVEELQQNGIPQDWCGVWAMTKK